MSPAEGIAKTDGRTGHYVTAVLFMAIGAPVVLGVVVTMNELSAPPERKEVERVTELEVQKAPKPKPKQQVKRSRPKPKKAPKAPPRPFLGAMGSGLAGIAFDLPGLQFEDLGGNAKDLLTTEEEVVHTSDTVDDPPQPVEAPPPEFPKRLADRGIEGYVLLSALIDGNGIPQTIKVLESKPPGEFDQAAIDGFRQWRFQPALYKGEAVSVWVRQKIAFKLQRR